MTELGRSNCEECGRIVYETGTRHMIEAAVFPNGECPVDEFLASLENSRKPRDRDRLATILMLLEDYAEGELEIPRELNDLRDGIWELKAGDVRLPFFAVEGTRTGAIRLTHGFVKQGEKAPRKQIDMALWVRSKDKEVDKRDESL